MKMAGVGCIVVLNEGVACYWVLLAFWVWKAIQPCCWFGGACGWLSVL